MSMRFISIRFLFILAILPVLLLSCSDPNGPVIVNKKPILDPIGNKSTTAGTALGFTVTASDPDGSITSLTSSTLPTGATFIDNDGDSAVFGWTPLSNQVGDHSLTFYATDDSAAVDSETITITVFSTGNDKPVLAGIGNQIVSEETNLNFVVTATDPDSTIPTLSVSALPAGAFFVDGGDGSGVFDWTPLFNQVGIHNVTFYATDDSLAVDSELVRITVNLKPSSCQNCVVAVNGRHYRMDVDETTFSPELLFAVADESGFCSPDHWINYSIIEGDGFLEDDSSRSDSSCMATVGYSFGDSLGHAIIRASAPGKDSVDVNLRFNGLVPGLQGQYLLLGEEYGVVKMFNGLPDELVVHPTNFLFIADYEQSLGVVVILADIDQDEIVGDNDTIIEIIVNDNEDGNPVNNYKGRTRDSLGIGSMIADLLAVYGPADDIFADVASQPFYWRYRWLSLGLIVYTSYVSEADRDVREIHIRPPS